MELKEIWMNEIKRVLQSQFNELRGNYYNTMLILGEVQ